MFIAKKGHYYVITRLLYGCRTKLGHLLLPHIPAFWIWNQSFFIAEKIHDIGPCLRGAGVSLRPWNFNYQHSFRNKSRSCRCFQPITASRMILCWFSAVGHDWFQPHWHHLPSLDIEIRIQKRSIPNAQLNLQKSIKMLLPCSKASLVVERKKGLGFGLTKGVLRWWLIGL